MKVLSLISTALLTLSLAGAVQAQPAAAHIAPATIAAAPCAANEGAKCKIDAPIVKRAPVTIQEPKTFIMLMLGLVALGVAAHPGRSSQFLND